MLDEAKNLCFVPEKSFPPSLIFAGKGRVGDQPDIVDLVVQRVDHPFEIGDFVRFFVQMGVLKFRQISLRCLQTGNGPANFPAKLLYAHLNHLNCLVYNHPN